MPFILLLTQPLNRCVIGSLELVFVDGSTIVRLILKEESESIPFLSSLQNHVQNYKMVLKTFLYQENAGSRSSTISRF